MTQPRAPDETRIDRWLCAVRLVKTRPLATRLCEGGHVRVTGSPAKASTKVRATGGEGSPSGIMAVRGEGRPSKRLRRELERMRQAAGP